eukprot:6010339-Prymnesium_polylepis.2
MPAMDSAERANMPNSSGLKPKAPCMAERGKWGRRDQCPQCVEHKSIPLHGLLRTVVDTARNTHFFRVHALQVG